MSSHFGVYKPHVSISDSVVRYFSSNYHAEIAAYEFDKILHLNMVPLTYEVRYNEYKIGSQHYFVENAYRSREMMELSSSPPGKFSKSKGRVAKTNDIRFFDWLISNYDSNSDNYLFITSGEIVLIDHGFLLSIQELVLVLVRKKC